MPDAIYTDRRLAELYDSLNPEGPDTDFYRSLAKDRSRVLDLGCGTGLLAMRLATDGHDVTGVDPAAAMLAIAGERDGRDAVRWIGGEIDSIDPSERFDLVLMTGHVFQVFLDDDAALRVLQAIHRRLAHGGRLVFDSRNPGRRAWERWTPAHSLCRIHHSRLGEVEVWHDVVSVERGIVVFDTHTRFPGEKPIASRSSLAFRDMSAIARLLDHAGLARVDWMGNWAGDPFGVESDEIIVVAYARECTC